MNDDTWIGRSTFGPPTPVGASDGNTHVINGQYYLAEIELLRAKLAEVERERNAATSALERKGYRKSCDISLCNCGDQWTHGGHAEMRLTEIREALEQADARRNGETILADVVHALGRVEQLEAAIRDAPCGHDGPTCAVYIETACTCWKRDALEGT